LPIRGNYNVVLPQWLASLFEGEEMAAIAAVGRDLLWVGRVEIGQSITLFGEIGIWSRK
jgi:hypothetical protein